VLNEADLEHGFDTVIVAATDVQGRLFGRRVPVHRFQEEFRNGLDICTCALAWDVTQDLGVEVPFAGWHTGWNDFQLRPDLSTLRRYPGTPGTAICLCDVVDEHGAPVSESPRQILRRQVENAAAAGCTVAMASELEFYLFHGTSTQLRRKGFRMLEPTTVVRSDYSIVGGAEQEPFIAQVRKEMELAGIPIYACQAEYGFGQWEVNFPHCNPVEMADRHSVYKAGLKELAVKAGLAVTFMARPVADDLGSSCHFHFSAWRDSEPVFPSPSPRELSRGGLHWVGGLLAHLDELALFFAPYVNSFKRHLAEVSGAVEAWGYDNRTTAVRVVGSGPSLHVEFRYPGADVNPYLAAAAVIAAGLDGAARQLDPAPPCAGNAYAASDLPRGPTSLGKAIDLFRASTFARQAFGEAVVAHYAALAEAEWNSYLSAVTDWDLKRAFELA
jgi:glutamine synthetase